MALKTNKMLTKLILIIFNKRTCFFSCCARLVVSGQCSRLIEIAGFQSFIVSWGSLVKVLLVTKGASDFAADGFWEMFYDC